VELRSVPLRIGHAENLLGSRGDGPTHPLCHRVWRSLRHRCRSGAVPYVPGRDPWHGLPKYLSSDHDPLYRFHQWQANLRVLEVNEIKTVPHVPLSHPFAELLIGTIRREHLATGPTRG